MPYSPLSLLLSLAFVITIITTPVQAAPGAVCSSGIYKELLALSAYPAAESFCSSRFPLPVSTVYSTVSPGGKHKRASTTSTTTTKKAASGLASILSNLEKNAESIISTACSCIETKRTITVWKTRNSTGNEAPLTLYKENYHHHY
jgi:hypothetical protein